MTVCALVATAASAQPRGHGHGGDGRAGGWHGSGGPRGGSGWHGGFGGYHPRGYGYGHYNPVPGVVGGILGGWLWRQFNQPEPEPQIVVVEPQRDVAWCMNRYRSYDPYTRTYLGFDGLRHGCP